MMGDEDYVPISALQHYLYCPRQCALIHIEQQWAESMHTAQGRLLHERADKQQAIRRRGVRTVMAMPIASADFGVTGIADVVEFHATPEGDRPVPVEYKRGRPKSHRADEVQLCAQAMCLESMLGCAVPAGALFYGQTHRRVEVVFDPELRELTRRVASEVREMLEGGRTPAACYEPRKCDACSLLDLCQPRLLERQRSVQAWLGRQLRDD